MEMRKCRACGETKKLNKFARDWNYKKINGVRTDIKVYFIRWVCLPCRSLGKKAIREKQHPEERKALLAAYYLKNREEIIKKNKKKRDENKDRSIQYLGGVCAKCSREYHRSAFDFHHIDPKTKDSSVTDLMCGEWEPLKAELDKCMLLCANDHRILHANLREFTQ